MSGEGCLSSHGKGVSYWCLPVAGEILSPFSRALVVVVVVVLALCICIYMTTAQQMAVEHLDKVILSHPLNKGSVWANGSQAERPKRNLFQGEFQNK